jgi:hypothetical protein
VPLVAAAVVVASLLVALAALVAVVVHQTRRVLHQPSLAVALALEVKEMLAVLAFALRVMPFVKAVAAVVQAVVGQLPHPQAALEPVALVLPTPSRPGLRNPTLAAAAVDRSLTHTLPVDRVVVAVAHLELAVLQLQAQQIPVAAVVVEPPTGHKMLLVVALVSW